MIVLFPMNGTGERFKEAGFKEWKPLIKVKEKPLIEKVLEAYQGFDKIAITREAFIPRLTKYFSMIIPCEDKTEGPAETIIAGTKIRTGGIGDIAIDCEVLIADCDSVIDGGELEEAITHFRNEDADGGVTVMESTNPNYSYAKLDKWRVLETREKDPFSEWTTTGPYYFKSWKIMVNAVFDSVINEDIYSISPCYNTLIKNGNKVVAYPVESFRHLGTPEDIKCFP